MININENEEYNGVRMSWNIWPSTRLDMTKIVVPMGALYTPLKKTKDLSVVNYNPVVCRGGAQCGCVFNPYCHIDFRAKTWTCNSCGYRNQLPPYYAERITEQHLPSEKHYSTIEYELQNTECSPPVFLFVLDTALNSEEELPEFEKAKEALQQALITVPQNALVGFVTFGIHTHVYELGYQEMPKRVTLNGKKSYSAMQVVYQLGMQMQGATANPLHAAKSFGESKFLMPVSECEFMLNCILDDLQPDLQPMTDPATTRTARCTGSALSVAVGLMENHQQAQGTKNAGGGRIVVLTSGPCTAGPGHIVSPDKAETMRSHHDIQKEHKNAEYVKAAVPFYAGLAARSVAAGAALDIFACSLDQVGLYEMRVLCDHTGGAMVMSDSFSYNVFRDSFRMLFSRVETTEDGGYLQMGFNAKIKAVCSRQFKVCGAVGGCFSLNNKHPSVSDTMDIGESGTSEWKTGVLDRNTTLAFFFEPSEKGTKDPAQQSQEASMGNYRSGAGDRNAYLQFQTLYHHPSGKKRLRVTTVVRALAEPDLSNIAMGFDQEAAAVLIARFAMCQIDESDHLDVKKKVDRVLIKLASRFGQYNQNDPMSFKLGPEFMLFPQFIYNLRRSNFLNAFNCSPDETAFYRTCMLRENVLNSLAMISPALMEYTFDCPGGRAVMLDAENLKDQVVLLLDSYFHVLIWRGETIQQWYDLAYHEKPEYANFKELLEKPAQDALGIMGDRFPAPKYIQTYAHGSASRFLVSRVNPSCTHKNVRKQEGWGDASGSGAYGEQKTKSNIVLTDEASYRVFLECLIKYAVQA